MPSKDGTGTLFLAWCRHRAGCICLAKVSSTPGSTDREQWRERVEEPAMRVDLSRLKLANSIVAHVFLFHAENYLTRDDSFVRIFEM
jgi:hypothetical protein